MGIPWEGIPHSVTSDHKVHLNMLLLFSMKENLKVLTNFSKPPKLKISWKSAQESSSHYMHIDGCLV